MAQPMSKAEWRRRKRRKAIIARVIAFSVLFLLAILLVFGVIELFRILFLHEKIGTVQTAYDIKIQTEFLTVNDYSRTGNRMSKDSVKGIVLHFTDEPGTTAMARRNYYEQLATTKKASMSTHFVVGTDGEIIQCIPVNEQCSANGKHNADMIAIEYCHSDEDGTPSEVTYTALKKLTAKLVKDFNLSSDQVYCHNAITENTLVIDCPRYFVNNPDKWSDFKKDVASFLQTTGDSLK